MKAFCRKVGAALVLLPALCALAWGRPSAPPRVDVLLHARALLRGGQAEAAALEASSHSSVAAHFLAGVAWLTAGRDEPALLALAAVPEKHALWEAAAQHRVGILRRCGRSVDAAKLVKELGRRGAANAVYLTADLAWAAQGCGAAVYYQKALKAQPTLPARHAARVALLQCASRDQARVNLALRMLEDAAPMDALRARETLRGWVEALGDGPLPAVSRDLWLQAADRLLLERLPLLCARVVEHLPPTANPQETLRQDLLLASAYGAQGMKGEKQGVLDRLLASPLGRQNVGVWRLALAVRAADLEPAQLAQENLSIVAQFPQDPLVLENRHLAGYYFSQAGDLPHALEQWDLVAQVPNPKQRDAAWFKARTLVAMGKPAQGAQAALAWSGTSTNTEVSSHLQYWAAEYEAAAGQASLSAARWDHLCHTLPARLYGALACVKGGAVPKVLEPAPPLPQDALELLMGLAADKTVSASSRAGLAGVATFYEAGAWSLAVSRLASILRAERGPPAVMLRLGELALVLGDYHSAVILAESRRILVDSRSSARWHRLAYPQVPWLEEAAVEEGVDPDLALAIARTESYFSPVVRSKAGAMGMMQLMPGTALELAAGQDLGLEEGALYDGPVNGRLGVRYLRLLQGDFGDRVDVLAAAYNAGPSNARKFVEHGRGLPLAEFLESINFRETRGYSKRVLEAYLNYKMLRGQAPNWDPSAPLEFIPGSSVHF